MRSVSLALVLLCVAARAFGQAPDLEGARRHFEAASQAFKAGDYVRAEGEFRAAWIITRDPILQYNLGQAQQQLGRLEDAVASYRAYLAGVPDADDRAEVEKLIRQLEERLHPTAKPTPPGTRMSPEPSVSARAPDVERPSQWRRTAAWSVLAGSVVAFGVGVGLTAVGASNASDAEGLQSSRDAGGQPLSFADVAGKFNSSRDRALQLGGTGIGLMVAAAVGGGVATYLFLTSKSGASSERPQARLRLVPDLSPRAASLAAGMEF